VPVADPEVGIVGNRVPRDVVPAVPPLQSLDLGLGSARREDKRDTSRVQVSGVRNLVGKEGAADAGALRVCAALTR